MDTCRIFAISLLITCPNSAQLSGLYGTGNFLEAKNKCSERGEILLGDTNWQTKTSAQQAIYTNVWIDVTIKRFEKLTWTTGLPVDDRPFGMYDEQCGILDTKDSLMYERPCKEKHFSLCQINDDSACPSSKANCFQMGGVYFIISSHQENWYEGCNWCELNDGKIAVIEKRQYISKLSRIIKHHNIAPILWLGARTMDWFQGGKERVQWYQWLDGQPDPKKDCVLLVHHQHTIGWKACHCGDIANIWCHKKESKATVSSPESETSNNLRSSLHAQPSTIIRSSGIENNCQEKKREKCSFHQLSWSFFGGFMSMLFVTLCCLSLKIGTFNKQEDKPHIFKVDKTDLPLL